MFYIKEFRSLLREYFPRCVHTIAIFLMISLFSCKNKIEDEFNQLKDGTIQPQGIKIEYPRHGTIFPPEMPGPEFIWKDTLNTESAYVLSVSTFKGEEILKQEVDKPAWKPEKGDWEKIKTVAGNENIVFTIVGKGKGILGGKLTSGKTDFSFSSDSVAASIFFREVPLPFGYAVNHVDQIQWYLGSVDGGKPQKVLENIPVCANCHSFTKDGSAIGMDVDYANDKGSYIVAPVEDTIKMTFDKIITWSDYKREDGERTFGLLSQISPDGRYVLSTVKDRSVFVPVDNLMYSQLFFPIKGMVAYYDCQQHEFEVLPGADDPSMVQSNPNWSPDGEEVLFSRTSRYYSASLEKSNDIIVNIEDVMEFVNHEKDFKFNLFRVPFNEGLGGEPQPVEGASNNNRSNYFARYSPDGKWLVFCQAENFMLLQPDSKLYIMPSKGGKPRLMNCNTDNMNSWHSWSPNGKWLVFSSKARGAYTQLFITHIDEQGNDSPPVLLENLVFDKQAANIPEFVNIKQKSMDCLVDSFSQSAFYSLSIARNDILNREFIKGFTNINKTIRLDSTYFDAYMEKITLQTRLGQTSTNEIKKEWKRAWQLIDSQVGENPNDPTLITKRANFEYYTGNTEAAYNDALKALKLNPEFYDAYILLALYYQYNKDYRKTYEIYRKILELKPNDKYATYHLALVYQEAKNLFQANRLVDGLLEKYPDEIRFYSMKADLLYQSGNRQGEKEIIKKAIETDPENYEGYLKRALFYNRLGQKDLAGIDFNKAISILSGHIGQNPEDLELIVFRAEIYEQIGNFNLALSDYRKFLDLLPLNFRILKRKAELEFNLELWLDTKETHTVLIENFPPQADYFFNRCYANIRLSDPALAKSDLKKAQELSKDNYYKLYDLAILKLNLNDHSGAQNDLEKLASYLADKKSKTGLTNDDLLLQQNVLDQLQQLKQAL